MLKTALMSSIAYQQTELLNVFSKNNKRLGLFDPITTR